MESTTIKPRGRCSGGCIPDTSGRRCAYCHFELSPNKNFTETKKSPKDCSYCNGTGSIWASVCGCLIPCRKCEGNGTILRKI